MKRPLIFIAAVCLVAFAVFAQMRWGQYPFVTSPAPDDTFMIGTATTNKHILATNLVRWMGTNVQPRWANIIGIPSGFDDGTDDGITSLSGVDGSGLTGTAASFTAGLASHVAGSPGNSKYYGTDSGGAKGFHDLPTGSGVTEETVTNIVNGMTLPATNAFGNPIESMSTDASRFGGLTNIQAHALGWALSNPNSATNHVLSLTNAILRGIEATNDVHLLFADAAPGRGASVDILASGGIRNFSSPTNGHWLVTTNLFTITGTNYTLAIPAGKVLTVSARQNFAGAVSSNLVVAAKLEGNQ
jgi:hypothetical protein